MLNDLTSWLLELVQKLFSALWDFVSDIVVSVLDMVLSALATLFALIPVPDVLSQGLGAVWGNLDSGVLYLVSAAGIPQVLAMFGAAYGFRLIRKVVTLFQW